MAGTVRRIRWAILPALAIAVVLFYVSAPIPLTTFSYPSSEKHAGHVAHTTPPSLPVRPTVHPIATLIRKGEDEFSHLVSKETHDLASAAKAYREARGRHPPPGFDTWYKIARQHDVVMVEEFWDQIYHDLRPFWALPANQIRADARANGMVVNIKGGVAEANTGWKWHLIWAHMIGTVSEYLPDMVVPCNSMDEPRLLVPWEIINGYLETEQSSRHLTASADTSNVYHNWSKDEEDTSVGATDVTWKDAASISLVRQACHPDSQIRKVNEISSDFRNGYAPEHMPDGFVANYTLATSLCHQPDIGMYHGAVNQPLTSSWSQQLTPLFGGSKMAMNNEILLPAPIPWTDDGRFSAGEGADTPWATKESQTLWRGTATGGRHHPTNWHLFHRHRFVYLTNGTKLLDEDRLPDKILTSDFLHAATSTLSEPTRHNLSEYLSSTNDVGFTDLFCDEAGENGSCWYLDNDYTVVPQIAMTQHFNYKYLPDIDGNSFSGRYRAFLLSTSLPIKATIYREWHDSRLVAWKHFVPMDNRFTDYYGILEYFRGFEGMGGGEQVPGHDEAAKKIAYDGRDWSRKVLRKEDMQIYVFRLLLEYARVCDDNRENLGFVGDLKKDR
jgi:Glycosyl transferase family 90